MNEEQRLVQKRLRVLEHAQKIGNVRKTCRYFGIARSCFYRWKRAFDRDSEADLVNKSRVARNIIWARFVLFGIWLAITV